MWGVNFGLGKSNNYCCVWAAGKEILQEEGDKRLIPSSTNVAVEAARDQISEEEDGICSSASSSSNVAGRLKQLNLNMQAQSVCSRCEVSDVINFRLGLVITPSWLSSEVVVCPACTLTTTSMLVAVCVLVLTLSKKH